MVTAERTGLRDRKLRASAGLNVDSESPPQIGAHML